jgi:hypothetical protein
LAVAPRLFNIGTGAIGAAAAAPDAVLESAIFLVEKFESKGMVRSGGF